MRLVASHNFCGLLVLRPNPVAVIPRSAHPGTRRQPLQNIVQIPFEEDERSLWLHVELAAQ
jgi:hypothetical protein